MKVEDGDIRELRKYILILTELVFIKKETYHYIEAYKQTFTLLSELIEEKPLYNAEYFNRTKLRTLRILEPFIDILINRGELLPNADWKSSFNDEANLYLKIYELDHIGYFQTQPLLHDNYYRHGRLSDHYALYNNELFFNPNSTLLKLMKEEIMAQIEYLRLQFV